MEAILSHPPRLTLNLSSSSAKGIAKERGLALANCTHGLAGIRGSADIEVFFPLIGATGPCARELGSGHQEKACCSFGGTGMEIDCVRAEGLRPVRLRAWMVKAYVRPTSRPENLHERLRVRHCSDEVVALTM